MDELNIVVNQTQGEITTNFKELEESLKLQMSAYKDFVVTEDEISIAKGDLAFLRKLKTTLDDRRKEVKKAQLAPCDLFEDQCKKLTALIDEPIKTIDSQLKLFEQDRIARKRERIASLYEELVGEFIDFLPIEKNYNTKWDNKSYTDNDIRYDISEILTKVKGDINVIKSLNSEIESEVIEAYKNSGNDLSKAIARNQQYINDKLRIEEAKKAEEARKAEEAKKVEEVVEEVVEEPDLIHSLDSVVQMTKTVKIIIAATDLQQAKNCLDFADIKYQIVED